MGDPSDGDEGGALDVGLEIGVQGALLRASQEGNGDLLGHLANLLGSALPAITKVETRGGFLSPKTIASLRVEIDDNHFSITRAKSGLLAEKHKFVRGVRLSSRQTPVDDWIRELAAEIGRLAEANDDARRALERMIFGRS
jgi:hypothetical protein